MEKEKRDPETIFSSSDERYLSVLLRSLKDADIYSLIGSSDMRFYFCNYLKEYLSATNIADIVTHSVNKTGRMFEIATKGMRDLDLERFLAFDHNLEKAALKRRAVCSNPSGYAYLMAVRFLLYLISIFSRCNRQKNLSENMVLGFAF